ncbi:MAG TPA: DUF4870 domain-containing protein [Vicinamibacteria bacterium]|nr:DUF4870 domain-containing protein [Vicinamibacteria bacterium]
MGSPASPSGGQTNLGMAPNVAGMLCYFPLCCVGIIMSVVAAVVEKQSRFVRFHAFQSLLVHGVLIVVVISMQIFQVVLGMVSGLLALLFTAIFGLLGLGVLAAMVFLMIKAYNNEEYQLPTIGEMAKKWAQGA